MSCKCSGTCKWIGGFLTGAVIGAAASLLFAPKSGEETRSEIRESIQDTYYDAYDAVLGFGEKISAKIADLKDDFQEWAAKAKDEAFFEAVDEEESAELDEEEAEEADGVEEVEEDASADQEVATEPVEAEEVAEA